MQYFTERDREDLMQYLEDQIETGMLFRGEIEPDLFVNHLFEAAESDAEFRLVLRQWLNRKNPEMTAEIEENGFRLHAMMQKYRDQRFGILMSLLPLYLERTEAETYHDIAGFAGIPIYADEASVSEGVFMDTALLNPEDGCWYVLGKACGPLRSRDEALAYCRPYEAWTLLLDYPELIAPLSEGYPEGTVLIRRPDALEYDAELPESGEEADAT